VPCWKAGFFTAVGTGRGRPKLDKKLKEWGRKNAPLWWKSSQNQSAMGAWGEAAFRAGWRLSRPVEV